MNATQQRTTAPRDVQYRRAGEIKKNTQNNVLLSYLCLLFMPTLLFIYEFLLKISLYNSISFKELFLSMNFAIATGLIATLVCRIFACLVAWLAENKNIIRPLSAILIGLCSLFFTVLFLVQFVYFSFFGDYFKWSTITMAGDVTDFYREIIHTVLSGWYWVILFIIPIILYAVFPARKMPTSYIKPAGLVVMIAVALFCHFGAVAIIYVDDDDYGDKTYYTEIFNAPYAVKNFGLLAETGLDLKQMFFGEGSGPIIDDDIDIPSNNIPDVIIKPSTDTSDTNDPSQGDSTESEIPIEYDYNIMNIDFESLIANEKDKTIKSMHEYFSSLEGTKQNKYTGYFKGKNIIFITLEGFSHKAISKELTPTLYKMSTEGFVFKNYYNSLWGGSTATGEYAILTGNFYKSAKCLEMSSSTYQPFAIGNQFAALNYNVSAYHNHTNTYYTRNKSHPNFGFKKWIAIGSGLKLPSQCWPNSDYEMAQVTVGDYKSSTPFATYYMTVSGHANYSWMGNTMSSKHRLRVQGLNYSENVKAYIACNLEVEDMLTHIMAELKAAGTLDDTVFVISEDHYPYALADAEIAELYGLPNDENLFSNLELYRNFFTIYSTSMESPVIVNEPCSAIDILPTVLNLFGIEYDSRLITGTDILSETPNTVILNCDRSGPAWNWITRYGSYNTSTKKFTPAEGVEFASEQAKKDYISSMNSLVKIKRQYSYLILEEDYYRHVFE